MRPVYFMSRKATPTQENWYSYELEAFVVVEVHTNFRIDLQGIPFKVVTDCEEFYLTLKNKELKQKIARW